MEKKIEITFRWWTNKNIPIDIKHQQALEETAIAHILNMWNNGFTAGELTDNIRMHDQDPEEGISYQGWWNLTTATV